MSGSYNFLFQIYPKTVKRSEILGLHENIIDAVRFSCSVLSPGKWAGTRLGMEGALAKPVMSRKIL
jgi:hypothetical protein